MGPPPRQRYTFIVYRAEHMHWCQAEGSGTSKHNVGRQTHANNFTNRAKVSSETVKHPCFSFNSEQQQHSLFLTSSDSVFFGLFLTFAVSCTTENREYALSYVDGRSGCVLYTLSCLVVGSICRQRLLVCDMLP